MIQKLVSVATEPKIVRLRRPADQILLRLAPQRGSMRCMTCTARVQASSWLLTEEQTGQGTIEAV